MNVKAIDKQYVANTYNRFDLQIVSGKGSLVKDADGKEYIDMGSGIAVTSFGVADEDWIIAVKIKANNRAIKGVENRESIFSNSAESSINPTASPIISIPIIRIAKPTITAPTKRSLK